MTVSLAGFMGCGKSSVGRILSGILGWEFIDLDEYITHKTGKSPAGMIRENGQEWFRCVEAEAVRDIFMMQELRGTDLVLALGGGTPTIGSIRHLIFDNTFCVYLRTSACILKERLEACREDRPLLESADFEKLLGSRQSAYEAARYTVDTDGRDPLDVAREIELSILK